MCYYRFSLRDERVCLERVCGIELTDDIEALTFGQRVAQDLIFGGIQQYAGRTMKITEGVRVVGSISLEGVSGSDQKK